MFFQRLVMLPPQLRPACKVVLGADGGHFTLEAHHFSAQADLRLQVSGGGQGEAGVELP